MTTPGDSGAPLQIKIDGTFRTVAIHVGLDDSKNWATLITDKVYLDFIIPYVNELSDWYGTYTARDSNKAKKNKIVIDTILEDRKEDMEMRE